MMGQLFIVTISLKSLEITVKSLPSVFCAHGLNDARDKGAGSLSGCIDGLSE